MSRNKDIQLLHEVTGKPYSVCRAQMKAVNWDLGKALLSPEYLKCLDTIKDVMEGLKPCLANMCEAVGNMCHNLGDMCYSVADNLKEEQIDDK